MHLFLIINGTALPSSKYKEENPQLQDVTDYNPLSLNIYIQILQTDRCPYMYISW